MKIRLTEAQIKKLIQAELLGAYHTSDNSLNEEAKYETSLSGPGECKINIFEQEILNFLLALIIVTTPGLNIFATKSVCDILNKAFGGATSALSGLGGKGGGGKKNPNGTPSKSVKNYFSSLRKNKINATSLTLLKAESGLVNTELDGEPLVEDFERKFKDRYRNRSGVQRVPYMLEVMHPDSNKTTFKTEYEKAKKDGVHEKALKHALYDRILRLIKLERPRKSSLESYLEGEMESLE